MADEIKLEDDKEKPSKLGIFIGKVTEIAKKLVGLAGVLVTLFELVKKLLSIIRKVKKPEED